MKHIDHKGKTHTKTHSILHRVGTEVKENPPAILAKTRAKSGPKRAEAQRTAIVLDKARRAGAHISKGRKK